MERRRPTDVLTERNGTDEVETPTDGRMHGAERTGGRNGRNGRMDGWIDRSIDRSMAGWIDGRMDGILFPPPPLSTTTTTTTTTTTSSPSSSSSSSSSCFCCCCCCCCCFVVVVVSSNFRKFKRSIGRRAAWIDGLDGLMDHQPTNQPINHCPRRADGCPAVPRELVVGPSVRPSVRRFRAGLSSALMLMLMSMSPSGSTAIANVTATVAVVPAPRRSSFVRVVPWFREDPCHAAVWAVVHKSARPVLSGRRRRRKEEEGGGGRRRRRPHALHRCDYVGVPTKNSRRGRNDRN